MNRSTLVSTLILALTLTGCATRITQSNQIEAPASANRYSTTAPTSNVKLNGNVAVLLTANSAVMQKSGWLELESDWEKILPKIASAEKTNAAMISNESALTRNQTMLVKVKVNDFRYTSTAKRILLGVMAGNAYMDLEVEYIQLPSKRVLASKRINTTSSAWEGIASAVTPRQIQTVSKQIIQDTANVRG